MSPILKIISFVGKKDTKALKQHFASSLSHGELVDARIEGRIWYWKAEAMRRVRERAAQEKASRLLVPDTLGVEPVNHGGDLSAAIAPASKASNTPADESPSVGIAGHGSLSVGLPTAKQGCEPAITDPDMNLTSQQKGLLFATVDGHAAAGGNPFIYVHNSSGRGLCYAGGHSVMVDADHSDFVQLQRERLITFTQQKWPSVTGKPTQSGIDAVAALRSHTAESGQIGPAGHAQPIPEVSSTNLGSNLAKVLSRRGLDMELASEIRDMVRLGSEAIERFEKAHLDSTAKLRALVEAPPAHEATLAGSVADSILENASSYEDALGEFVSEQSNPQVSEDQRAAGFLKPDVLADAASVLTSVGNLDWNALTEMLQEVGADLSKVDEVLGDVVPLTPRSPDEQITLFYRFSTDPKGLGLSVEQMGQVVSPAEWLEHFRAWERKRQSQLRPRTKRGRPPKNLTQEIRAEWAKMGSPASTAKVCDKIGTLKFGEELKGHEPGSAQHRRVRERVRKAIERSSAQQTE